MKKLEIYIGELLAQIKFAKRCFNDFESSLEKNDIESVFFHLHHFTVHVANIDKLLNPKANSNRENLYANHINLDNIDLKSFRKLRNHLEHFDERLDSWIETYDGHAFFDNNIVTDAKGFPNKAFLRALDGYVYKFYGEDYPLKPLVNALESLESLLKSIPHEA